MPPPLPRLTPPPGVTPPRTWRHLTRWHHTPAPHQSANSSAAPISYHDLTRLDLDYAAEPPIPGTGPASAVTAADVIAWAAGKFYAALPGLNETSTFRVEPAGDVKGCGPGNDWVDDLGVRHVRLLQIVTRLDLP